MRFRLTHYSNYSKVVKEEVPVPKSQLKNAIIIQARRALKIANVPDSTFTDEFLISNWKDKFLGNTAYTTDKDSFYWTDYQVEYYLEVDSLEELMDFVKHSGALVVTENTLSEYHEFDY